MDNVLKFDVLHLKEVNSTNIKLREDGSFREAPEGTVILADYQTAGKGQGKNSWYSSPGKNITLSLLLRPEIQILHHFALAEFISLALVDMLSDFGIDAIIKWPNDIYVDDRKIAGILIENLLIHDRIKRSICGIGLNVNEISFPVSLPNPVSMSQLLDRELTTDEVLDKLLEKICARYKSLKSCDFPSIHKEYNAKLYKLGKRCNFAQNNHIFNARIVEVKGSGEMVLQMESGETAHYLFGEISFKIEQQSC